MYLWLNLYTVPFFVSGQTYKISKGSNNYCSHCTWIPVRVLQSPWLPRYYFLHCFISSAVVSPHPHSYLTPVPYHISSIPCVFKSDFLCPVWVSAFLCLLYMSHVILFICLIILLVFFLCLYLAWLFLYLSYTKFFPSSSPKFPVPPL